MSPTPFDPRRFAAALRREQAATGSADAARGVFGCTLVVLGTVGSTQAEARAFVKRGAGEGTVVLAEEQSAGRGRRTRVWCSPRGAGLWATIVLRRSAALEAPALLTLAGAVALCEAARSLGVRNAEIKWPNDLVAGDLKLAGILGEMASGADGPIALLGFGVNVDLRSEDLPPEVASRATSLRSVGLAPALGREELLAALLPRLENDAAELALGRRDPLLARWAALSPTSFGRRARIAEQDAGTAAPAFEGTTRGIAPDGSLRIETAPGRIVPVRHGGSLEILREAATGPVSEERTPRR